MGTSCFLLVVCIKAGVTWEKGVFMVHLRWCKMVDKLQILRNGSMSISVSFNKGYCQPGERWILSTTNCTASITQCAPLVDMLQAHSICTALTFSSLLFCFFLPLIPSTSFLPTYFIPNKLTCHCLSGAQLLFFSIFNKMPNSIYAPVFSYMWQIILTVSWWGKRCLGDY